MFDTSIEIRVRYAETDQMGYCYYGNYAQYYEVARVEGLRKLGIIYKDLEAQGYLLPVSDIGNLVLLIKALKFPLKWLLPHNTFV